jgi:hypothetical protein
MKEMICTGNIIKVQSKSKHLYSQKDGTCSMKDSWFALTNLYIICTTVKGDGGRSGGRAK